MTQGELGNLGEFLAEQDYIKDGYVVLAKNYTTRAGEIDLILTFGSSLIFSEVKTRKSISFNAPREAVDKRKQNKIITATQEFLMNYPEWDEKIIRFDVVEVVCSSKEKHQLNRLENAFVVE